MHSSFHKSNMLRFLAIWPDDYDKSVSYPLIFLLHGFGANMQDLMFVAPALSTSGYIYLLPNAPISFNMGLGRTGFGWTPPREQVTPDDVTRAETILSEFFDEMLDELKVSPGQALLMGFSQGGGMTYRCGLKHPDKFPGIAALSSSAPSREELVGKLPQDRSQSIFISHGRYDRPESLERARTTQQFLTEQGYRPEYHEYDMGHEIRAEVLRDLAPWVTKVLPPYGAQKQLAD